MDVQKSSLEAYIQAGDLPGLEATAGQYPVSDLNQALSLYSGQSLTLQQLQCVQFLVRTGATAQDWMLVQAVRLQAQEIAESLIAKGCTGQGSLIEGKSGLLWALENRDLRGFEAMIQRGAELNAGDWSGDTPLHYAARLDLLPAVKLLLDRKADLMRRNSLGDTPLHVAIRAGYREIAVKLVEAGASLSAENAAGQTALSQADERLATELKRDSGRRTTHSKPKRQENGNKKMSRWREVPKAAPAPEQPCEGMIQQLRVELAQALEGKKAAEQQIQALQYILGQQSLEIEQLRAKAELSFLYLSTRPQALEQLHFSLQRDVQRFEEEVESWQARTSPILESLVVRIRTAAGSLWTDAEVEVYGSFAQGLHLPASDLDIVISGCKQDSVSALSRLESLLQNQYYVSSTTLLSTAYIPLLKVQAKGTHAVMIDISVAQSQHSGKSCTALVQTYLQRFAVLRPLLLVLKQVLYAFQFHEPFKGGLGSYGLTLMTVFALQQKGKAWETANSDKSAQALLEFFHFYTTFPFLSPINPTDLASQLEPDSLPDLPYLLIQDPLNLANNVGRNTNLAQLQTILKACYKALTRVVSGPNALVQMLSAARLALLKGD